jgi:ABC-2 type transport system ATP-binding protein
MTATDVAGATPAPDVIRVENVAKRFVVRKDNSLKERLVTLGRAGRHHRDDFWAIDDVSFTVQAGTTIGLIGHNGSGKSTLLKLIGGILDPTRGSISRRGRIAALLELGAGFHPDLTGRENVYLNASILGLSEQETEARLQDILDFSGIGDFIDTQVKFYSSGMYVRLAFAVAVHTDPDILLVDEVLAVGDEAFQRKCMDKILTFQAEGRTIVLVTHSLSQVTELCDRAILLNQGKVVHDGEPREAVQKFRDILEERRLREHVAVDQPTEAERGRIRWVTASARGREIGAPIEPGDDLVLRAEIESPIRREDWVFAFQIDNALGQVVYTTTTLRANHPLEPLEGSRVVELTIADVRLGPGKYFVNASYMDVHGRHLYDVPQATSFNAADYDLSVGILYAKPSFRVLSVNEDP